MDSLLVTLTPVAPVVSSPATLAAAVSLLLFGALLLVRTMTEKRRQSELRVQIATLASQVTQLARQVAVQAPAAKATIRSLRATMESSEKLKDEEQLLDDLLVRARVLASAANADAHAEAVKGLKPSELKQRLQSLQLDAKRMRGIWDTLEATAWVLRRSEEAIRRTAQNQQQQQRRRAAAARAA